MKRTIWFYGLALALLTALLKVLEYRFYLRHITVEFYIGLVAVLFTAMGIWMGLKLTRSRYRAKLEDQTLALTHLPKGQQLLSSLSISNREYEVLELMAAGHSNQEIADQLFISLNTVKTHSSNLFAKLEVSRRTQAVQKARALGIIE